MSENVEISYPSEECYETAGAESIAIANTTVYSEPIASDNGSKKMDTFVAEIGDKCAGESVNVTEHEVQTTHRPTKRGTKPEVSSKRRQTGTVLWEPLLVPTEVDGKYEMVTALKRVDSDYISSPRVNPRIVGAQIVKEANLPNSPRMEMQGATYVNTSTKVTSAKGSTDSEFKRGVKKEIAKKKAPDIKISEQMGKAIAEKEAAILKEIEKAMKEANLRNKSVLLDKGPKIKITSQVLPSQNTKRNESTESVSDQSKNSEIEKDGKKLTPSSQIKDVSAPRVQNVSNVSKPVTSSGVGLVTKEMHGLSKGPAVLGKIVTTSSSATKPVTKEAQSVNRILQVPRTLMITSTGGTVPKDVQVTNKILCGPATVVSSPTTTAVITTRDTHAVNQVITVPVNTSPNPQTLTEISPNAGARILFLASPTGGLPLLTPILPTTSIPFIQTPVNTSTMAIPRGSVEMIESPRITSTRPRRERELSYTIPETGLQIVSSESLNVKDSDVLRTVSSKKAGSVKKVVMSHEGASEEKQGSLSSQNIQLPSEAKTQLKHNKAQSPLHVTTKGNKSSTNQSGDKNALIASKDKSETSETIEKQERTIKSSDMANVTVNGKTAAKKSPIQKRDSLMTGKNQQKADCNGENMDIDDESVSEELDQGFVDDTRNINGKKLCSGKTKDTALLEENKHRGEQKRKSPRKSLQKEPDDRDSQDVLEKRLEKIENLYKEIPPSKARLTFSEEEYSKIRDGFRDNMRTLKSITASFKDLINQSSSLSCKGLIHSSSQTETAVDTHATVLVANQADDDKTEVAEGDLELCRFCGGFFKADSLISLFGKLSKTKDLLSMWSTILPQTTPVKEDDGLPQQVCEACVEKLTLCHSIISQFLQADKELRQVLQDEKPFSAGSMNSEETCVTHPQENGISSEEIVSSTVDNLQSQQSDSETPGCIKEGSSEEGLKDSEKCTVETRGQKRCAHVEVESTIADKSPPNSKHKRRRNKSSSENESSHATKTSTSSGSSSGCIDLSRLDPEFNVGFEVEWCLDEETIRSHMVPEEDVSPGLSEDPAAPTSVTAEGASETGQILSAGPEGCADSHAGKLELHPVVNPQKKKKGNLGNDTPKHTDEVSNLFEVPTSVCRSPVKSGNKLNPVSTVPQEKSDVHPNVLTQSPTLLKCSSCPLSFRSKQELMLHQVMLHEKAGTSQRAEGKQDSSEIKPKNLPQKQISSSNLRLESESCEESIMCDQCGLPFPNEYSLSLHKSVIHGTSVNSQLIIKDSKGFEYKIIDSKESLEENTTNQEIPEASMSEGKILVKCGSGMLWVNCSKYFSEEQMALVQSSDLTEVNYMNVENNTVMSDQNSPTASSQCVAKVHFAYMCDHCKQIFPSRAELLPHMQIHLNEKYSCSECSAKFVSVKALHSHVSIHVPLDRVCDECGLILVDSKKLVQHRKEHTHNLPHVCETCGKRFPNEQTLEVHETVHYSKKGPLACSLCRKCFFFKHSLVRHRSQHASNRLQKCSLCFRVLNSSDQLRKHVALHHLMKNFVCFCKQTFPSQKELVEHRYLKHSYAEIFCARNKVEIVEPLPLHQCSVCLRVLNSKQSLQKHHATSHSSTWPFFCIQCSRKYTSKYHLARHECHRKNTSSFQCKICGKAFQNKDIFKQHKVIHNNRKWRYICRHCGKTFQKSQSLVSHIMTHGGKKFVCPRCHQPCQDKEGLLKHYNTGSCQMKKKHIAVNYLTD